MRTSLMLTMYSRHSYRPLKPTSSVAASAMSAAQRTLISGLLNHAPSSSTVSNGISTEDYIGQFEREHARSFSCHGFEHSACHHRQESRQSDSTEKFMELPEPSSLEGMCTCRGILNISSMLLILCGLVLFMLGYPIVSALRKDRLLAESAASAATLKASAALRPGGSENEIAFAASSSALDSNAPLTVGISQVLTSSNAKPESFGRGSTLIDPETPLDMRTKMAYDGAMWSLVFSDEFNQDNRSFGPGDDPFWEAVSLETTTTGLLEQYIPGAIRTNAGRLEITVDRTPTPPAQHARDQKHQMGDRSQWTFSSGMLQSWNKLCVQGALVEVAVSLPGNLSFPGLKPRVFLLGNLDSLDNNFAMARDQTSSASKRAPPTQTIAQIPSAESWIERNSRGGHRVPKISLLEVHYGVRPGSFSIESQRKWPTPYSQQFQGENATLGKIRQLGLHQHKSPNFECNLAGSGSNIQGIAVASIKTAALPPTNSSNNITRDPQWIKPLKHKTYESQASIQTQFMNVGVEYLPRGSSQTLQHDSSHDIAYARFMLDNQWQASPLLEQEQSRLIAAENNNSSVDDIRPWRTAKVLEKDHFIPQEPMSIVLSLGLLQDVALLHPEVTFPAIMKIDYVRVYQPTSASKTRGLSCDATGISEPTMRPTHPKHLDDDT
ncbi:hypothetical protein BGZ94_010299 [Podila epigama]|nr:hypothetical protein BGZ94_010299 [Podila epigama]